MHRSIWIVHTRLLYLEIMAVLTENLNAFAKWLCWFALRLMLLILVSIEGRSVGSIGLQRVAMTSVFIGNVAGEGPHARPYISRGDNRGSTIAIVSTTVGLIYRCSLIQCQLTFLSGLLLLLGLRRH